MGGLTSTVTDLENFGFEGILPFEPRALYYETMDFLLYLEEDLPYRADRVDQFLTLLWHPHEDRAIGVKIKGIRVVFDRIRAFLKTKNMDISGSRFMPFVSAIEMAFTMGLGSVVTLDVERKRLEESYETARNVVGSVEFDAERLVMAA